MEHAYLIGTENGMMLVSERDYSNLWNGASMSQVVHKGYFYSTYDHGLNNGLFVAADDTFIAETRNGLLYRTD